MKPAATIILLVCLAAIGMGQPVTARQADRQTSRNEKLIARGKYLSKHPVDGVSGCDHCHTPLNQRGEPVQEKTLQGAPVLFRPTLPLEWADRAPNIAGLPSWDDAQAVHFLMTGIAYNGLKASLPMPAFRFDREDALALVAFLRSVEPAPSVENGVAEKPTRQ